MKTQQELLAEITTLPSMPFPIGLVRRRVVSYMAAILLGYLISKVEEGEGCNEEGWFRCDNKTIREELGFPDYKQRRYLRELIRSGVVDMNLNQRSPGESVDGVPLYSLGTRRWVRVDFKIIRFLQERNQS